MKIEILKIVENPLKPFFQVTVNGSVLYSGSSEDKANEVAYYIKLGADSMLKHIFNGTSVTIKERIEV